MAAVADVRQAEARHAHQRRRRSCARTVASSSSVDSSNGYAAEREAGVVEEDVEPAELVHRARDEALAALLVGDVELERDVGVDPLDAPRAARDADARPRAASRTVAAPMPLDAPVTIAVLPSRLTAPA